MFKKLRVIIALIPMILQVLDVIESISQELKKGDITPDKNANDSKVL